MSTANNKPAESVSLNAFKQPRAFYLIFFMLLMSLEPFVVTSKMGDQECDYEMAIKGAEKVKMAQFNMAFNRVQAK